jgi:TPP-dependent pyruvate/acetoin dehydrogenase alpha subunit
MMLIRRFEEKAAEQYTKAKIRGFLYLYIGEEAVAVGVTQALNDDDNVLISSRIMEKIFYELDAPVQRLCDVEAPIPYPLHLENASVPQKDDIVNAVKK